MDAQVASGSSPMWGVWNAVLQTLFQLPDIFMNLKENTLHFTDDADIVSARHFCQILKKYFAMKMVFLGSKFDISHLAFESWVVQSSRNFIFPKMPM